MRPRRTSIWPLQDDQEEREPDGKAVDSEVSKSVTEATDADNVRFAMREELEQVRTIVTLAQEIAQNAKGQALVEALVEAFDQATALGAARKAVVFTESRRTQNYLYDLLHEWGYGDELVLINGANDDARSKAIYSAWLARHAGSDAVTGVRAVDMKAAIIDEFRARGQILIATEAAAEGVNLQFCALVVNYDLPWNPQRVEQRIGRCHRYGQKHDVIVVNFLKSAQRSGPPRL